MRRQADLIFKYRIAVFALLICRPGMCTLHMPNHVCLSCWVFATYATMVILKAEFVQFFFQELQNSNLLRRRLLLADRVYEFCGWLRGRHGCWIGFHRLIFNIWTTCFVPTYSVTVKLIFISCKAMDARKGSNERNSKNTVTEALKYNQGETCWHT